MRTLAGEPRSDVGMPIVSLSATVHSADWVIPVDAGELWWPHGGSLAQLLSAIPSRYDLVGSVLRGARRAPAGIT